MNTVEILKELIRIPSFVDGEHNEVEIADYIENFLRENTKYKFVTQQVEGNRRNILVFNKSNPKIALFGHMDTVLPKAETDKPFEPRIEGDKLYGLGSVDMKGGLAIMLKLATEIDSDDFALVFSVDEEYDFKGAKKMMEISDFHPKTIINVEPTDKKILNGCRGITEFSFDLFGKSAHAGTKHIGINAIESVIAINEYLQQELSKYDSPSLKTTTNLAFIHGGILEKTENGELLVKSMGNVVPDFAKTVIEIRLANKNIDKDVILNIVTKKSIELGTRIENFKFKFFLGSMYTPKENLVAFEQVIENKGIKAEYEDISNTGYFELQMLQEKWGSECLIFGCGPASMSHAANEYVSIKSIKEVQEIIECFVKQEILIG